MKSEVKTINPEIARELLKNNTINRPLSMANVDFLKKEILEGRWEVTHQGLCIAKDGTLIDGQHRLQAIIKANKEVDILVTYDLDRQIFKFVDRGKRRNNADIFSIEGFSYPKELPQIINKIIRWNDGVSISNRDNVIDVDTQLEFARMNEVHLYDAIVSSKQFKKSVYPPSLASFVYWLLDRKNVPYSGILDQIMSGITTDPFVVAFRNELIDNQIKRMKMDSHVQVAKTLHTILCSIQGKKKRLQEYTVRQPYDLLDQIIRETRVING